MSRRKTKRCRRRNKQNAGLNREWGSVKKWMKRLTSRIRRLMAKDDIKDRLINE
jgi:hypothetical protein